MKWLDFLHPQLVFSLASPTLSVIPGLPVRRFGGQDRGVCLHLIIQERQINTLRQRPQGIGGVHDDKRARRV